jgi:hypothetical protein
MHPLDLIYVESYNTRREAMYREWVLKSPSCIEEKINPKNFGAVAQLGERLNGIQEVVGSIPISSTI